MAVSDDELSARVAYMLEQFKVVSKTKKCLSNRQKRRAVKNLLHKNFEDPLVDDLFEDYKMSLILDEAVRQLQRGITTAAKSPRSPSIRFENLRKVKEESIEDSGVQGIEAMQTSVSPAGLSSAAAEDVFYPGQPLWRFRQHLTEGIQDRAAHAVSSLAHMRFVVTFLAAALAGTAHAIPASALLHRAGPTLPSKDPFYFPTGDLSGHQPGAILQQRPPPAAVAAFGLAPAKLNRTQQLLYRTSDAHGRPIATVATILIPHNADLGKLLSYQIAVDAASIDCAPSYALQQGSERGPLAGTLLSQAEFLLIEAALEQGWAVVVPDFQGPQSSYLANTLAGYATLDGIRAALASTATTGIRSDARVAMWGYSGGSLASQWAAELQPSYAPGLHIAGAAVGGTVPDVASVIKAINGQPLAGFIPTGVLGLVSQYPEAAAPVDDALRTEAKKLFYSPLKQCLAANAAGFMYKDVLGMFKDRDFLLKNEVLVRISQENSLGKSTPKIPLFWYKSTMDEVSPVGDSDKLVDKYCDEGADVEYVRDVLSNHGSYAVIGAPLAFSWLKNVMNGKDGVPRKGCSKKTQLSGVLDRTQFEVLPKLIADALLDLLGKDVGPI